MPRVLLILALVLTAFWVFTIVDCAVQPAIRHRGVSKPVWILIVVLLPVLGGILWLVIGRSRVSAASVRRAPDDDPEFLGNIRAVSDQDERIRRLEEELALLDAEDDDPRWTPPAAGAAPAESATGTASPPEPKTRGGAPEADDDTRGQRGAAG
nr:PLD nuclease N-terminal domain-containing protein [Microbacterium sp. SS28]